MMWFDYKKKKLSEVSPLHHVRDMSIRDSPVLWR